MDREQHGGDAVAQPGEERGRRRGDERVGAEDQHEERDPGSERRLVLDGERVHEPVSDEEPREQVLRPGEGEDVPRRGDERVGRERREHSEGERPERERRERRRLERDAEPEEQSGARAAHAARTPGSAMRGQIPRLARMRSRGGSRFGTKPRAVMRSKASM